ncbi:hypothetical protein Hokovirus_3_44 [Hokovirus HKV1]|uniref:Uncharacterized protein n=1 Tax=Hokovirus HKV1 TaxID=1977638 RepID=A0A1V0SGH2_9VIRU|nr:hypothetical protein Hokovirus_3_44 [Hokovirus HKV1]
MNYKQYVEERDRKYFLDNYNLKMTSIEYEFPSQPDIILENTFGDKFKIGRHGKNAILEKMGDFLHFISKNNFLNKKNIMEISQSIFRDTIIFSSHINISILITLDKRQNAFKLSELQDLDKIAFNHLINDGKNSSLYFYDGSEACNDNLVKLLNKISDQNFYVENVNIIEKLYPTHIITVDKVEKKLIISKKPNLEYNAIDIVHNHKYRNVSECKMYCDLLYKEMETYVIKKQEDEQIQNNKKNFKQVISNLKEHILEKEMLKNKAKYNLVLKEIVKNNMDDKTFIRILGNYSYLLNLADLGTDKDEVQKIFIEDYGKNDLEKFLIVAYDYKDFRIINN